MDLPFLCIYQLFPWLPKFLDSRNRLNLHFLAVRQAIPLPLLPFLPFNSQRLTVGNSVLFTVTPPGRTVQPQLHVLLPTTQATQLPAYDPDPQLSGTVTYLSTSYLGGGGTSLTWQTLLQPSPGGFSDTWLSCMPYHL